MDMPFVDMHAHTFYSDGSMSPEEIVEEAVANRVGVLAIADHDLLEGGLIARELCRERGIRWIPAVEIDAIDGTSNFHILAYGFDVGDGAFVDFLGHTRFALDEMSVHLVEAMRGDFPELSIPEFMDFTYDRRLGGWKCLHYLMSKGLSESLMDGVRYYGRYGIVYERAGFASVASIAHRVHRAGGYAVLAHPGELIDTTDIAAFTAELRRVLDCGLDGVECYYPSHSEAVTRACLEVCRERGLMITAGSDCHGTFGGLSTRVGEGDVALDRLVLRDLLERGY